MWTDCVYEETVSICRWSECTTRSIDRSQSTLYMFYPSTYNDTVLRNAFASFSTNYRFHFTMHGRAYTAERRTIRRIKCVGIPERHFNLMRVHGLTMTMTMKEVKHSICSPKYCFSFYRENGRELWYLQHRIVQRKNFHIDSNIEKMRARQTAHGNRKRSTTRSQSFLSSIIVIVEIFWKLCTWGCIEHVISVCTSPQTVQTNFFRSLLFLCRTFHTYYVVTNV